MRISEAVAFIAALSQGSPQDTLSAREADYLLDEMDASDELRELVVADVVGGQYQCTDCFPDGCGARSEEHNATWREKEQYAQDVWDQPVSLIDLIHEIATATKEQDRTACCPECATGTSLNETGTRCWNCEPEEGS